MGMLVFSTSDKGGAGRSVTLGNIAYRLCMGGRNVTYVDFDFGSPTAGMLFEIGAVERGSPGLDGVHSYLLGETGVVARSDVRAESDRPALRRMGPRTGKLVLIPGDEGGAEFLATPEAVVMRCAELLLTLAQEFDSVLVDLTAGRSMALDLALRVTAMRQLSALKVRWLVFHRWTRQNILAASGLVYGPNGLVRTGQEFGHAPEELLESVRCVRTAVPAEAGWGTADRPAYAAWLTEQHAALRRLASANGLGAGMLLGQTPIEPVLHWREQVITDIEVNAKIAEPATVAAYVELARRLLDAESWERF